MTTMGGSSQEDLQDRFKEEKKFWGLVADAGGFDVEHLMEIKPPSCSILFQYDNFPTKIALYARIGLHRYNMIEGTNLQLSCIEKCSYRSNRAFMGYYITSVAKDPAAGNSLVTFQTRVDVEHFSINQVSCYIAQPKPQQQEYPAPQEKMIIAKPVDNFYSGSLPKWPSSENAFYDKKRFYVVRKSEVRKNDWIRLYMELAFLDANTRLQSLNLSKLVIVKVAVETKENVEPASERLKATNAIFYIKYRYYPNFKGRAPNVRCHNPPRDRIAIVRRTMDKHSGLLRLAFRGCRYSKTFLETV